MTDTTTTPVTTDMTAKQFMDSLEGFSERCISCKFLDLKNGYCSRLGESRKPSDPACDKWRYIG